MKQWPANAHALHYKVSQWQIQDYGKGGSEARWYIFPHGKVEAASQPRWLSAFVHRRKPITAVVPWARIIHAIVCEPDICGPIGVSIDNINPDPSRFFESGLHL